MPTLVFDIETVSEQNSSEVDALSPFSGSIITISVYDLERERGTVYYAGSKKNDHTESAWQLKHVSEAEMLAEFWEGIQSYDVYVGYATRRFDTPFLLHRSLKYEIPVSLRLLNKRLLTQQSLPFHVDLQDEFTFNGAMNSPSSLHTLAEFYNLNPSFLELLSLKDALTRKDTASIFSHCRNKLEVTAKLYTLWQRQLAPPHFLNTIEL